MFLNQQFFMAIEENNKEGQGSLTLLRRSKICSAGFSTVSAHLDTSVTSSPYTDGTFSPGPIQQKHTSTHTMGSVLLPIILTIFHFISKSVLNWQIWLYLISLNSLWPFNVGNIHQMSLEIKKTSGEPRGSSDVPEPHPEAPATCWLTPAQ